MVHLNGRQERCSTQYTHRLSRLIIFLVLSQVKSTVGDGAPQRCHGRECVFIRSHQTICGLYFQLWWVIGNFLMITEKAKIPNERTENIKLNIWDNTTKTGALLKSSTEWLQAGRCWAVLKYVTANGMESIKYVSCHPPKWRKCNYNYWPLKTGTIFNCIMPSRGECRNISWIAFGHALYQPLWVLYHLSIFCGAAISRLYFYSFVLPFYCVQWWK